MTDPVKIRYLSRIEERLDVAMEALDAAIDFDDGHRTLTQELASLRERIGHVRFDLRRDLIALGAGQDAL